MAAGLLTLALAGCGGGGSSGGTGSAGGGGAPGSATSGTAALAAATALNINITGVSIHSPPVVNFTVTNQAGVGMTGIVDTDLRFNIAKLKPGTNGEPSTWQNYINRVRSGAVQGSQERSASGYSFGTLVNHEDGSYTYTFATDITNPVSNPCPAPCTDADGKTLNLSYQPGYTHRITIQQGNSAYPKASGIFDFVPSGGVGAKRDIVLTSTCNQCHGQLTVHGTRVDTKLCVTCHNPGSWVAGTPNTTVDFKVMIHKIHYNNAGAQLPSVLAGTPYTIGSDDFSSVVFPQDVRNCTRCHDGSLSAQGDNWKTQPSMAACGACHDDVYFGPLPDPDKSYQTVPHPGGVVTDNSTCVLCHGVGKVADITVAHGFPARLKAAEAKFKFNIISVTPTTAGAQPVVTFSVTDPTNGDKPYDIKADAPFTAGSTSSLSIKLGWMAGNRIDIGNDDSQQDYGQPVSINALTDAVAGSAAGTYTVTSPIAIPSGPRTLRVMMDGHPAGDVTTSGTFSDRLRVKSVFKDFAITGTLVARRSVVDIAKCDVCHDVLSLHGKNRTDEPGVCVVCHNPNATDRSEHLASLDGKQEEAIDFKRMIHAIHAGQASNGGFREKGLVVGTHDFSNVVFPGKLSNCTACHTDTSYQLTGLWSAPTANGILGSTVDTDTSATDASDNLRISPTAAVCSSCHDSAAAHAHMTSLVFGAFSPGAQFSVTQAAIDGAAEERCSICHGPGGPKDIKVVHGVK